MALPHDEVWPTPRHSRPMPPSFRQSLVTAALALATAAPLAAQPHVTISTRTSGSADWRPLVGYYDYGDQPSWSGDWRRYGPYLVGQTFTVPTTATILQQFSVWLGGYDDISTDLRFQAYIMAWGTGFWPSGPGGDVLWASDVRAGSGADVAQGSPSGTEYRFFPGLDLTPGQQYVFFLSPHAHLGTSYPQRYLLSRVEGRDQDSYAGGTMVNNFLFGTPPVAPRLGGSGDLEGFLAQMPWTTTDTDLGFVAVFVTPEPGSVALVATGLGALGAVAWRRRRPSDGSR